MLSNKRLGLSVVGGGLGAMLAAGCLWLFAAVLSISISLGMLAAACWIIVTVLRHLGVAI